MVNILLPAYSRHFSTLCGAGQVTAADEMENHELEHLVLRERGVVWADQGGVGHELKGEGIGVESQKTNEAGSIGLHSELAPVLSFSHLLYHQSSPCSKLSYSLSSYLIFCCLFSIHCSRLIAKLVNACKIRKGKLCVFTWSININMSTLFLLINRWVA